MTAPVPMVEKVARAISDAHNTFSGQLRPWEAMRGAEREYGLSLARAAIAAMREPTEAMLAELIPNRRLRETWAAAIDAALSDTDGTR